MDPSHPDSMNDPETLYWTLWWFRLAAICFFPGMMAAYWFLVIPHRMGDIRSKLWNQRAIAMYVRLFTSVKVGEWTEEFRKRYAARTPGENPEFDRILLRDFKAVHGGINYLTSVSAVTFVVGLVVCICCDWALAKLAGHEGGVARLDAAVIMALAGAYVWSVFGVISRYRSRDLIPEDFMEMFLRHIAAVPIGYAFSLIAVDQVAPTLAFVSAAFPLRELRLFMRERALKKMGEQVVVPTRGGDGRLGKLMDSLSDDAIARLEELQIQTYMDLAYLNPTRLMARTGYSLRVILAWIDQALLVVYAAPHKDKLARFGIPCALDAQEFFRDHFAERDPSRWRVDPAVVALAGTLDLSVEAVHEIFKRVDEDPHVQFLEAIWCDERIDCEAAIAKVA